MPHFTCECGAKYRFAESAIGRRAKCKKCGTSFLLAPNSSGTTISVAKDPAPPPSVSRPPVTRARITTEDRGSAPPPVIPSPLETLSPPLFVKADPSRGYVSSILWTLVFPSTPHNLATFIALWLALTMGPLVPFIGFFIGLFLLFWYAAFCFLVVSSAAAGDSDLPRVGFSGDVVEEYLYPALRWSVSWMVVMFPAGLYLAFLSWQGNSPPWQAVPMKLADVKDSIAGGLDPALLILVGLGFAAWPITILCIALGGVGAALRVDLTFRTVVRTVDTYLITLLLLSGALGLAAVTGDLLEKTLTRKGGPPGGGAMSYFLGVGIELYCSIVLMRMIGLYYHHFKSRFAWSWG